MDAIFSVKTLSRFSSYPFEAYAISPCGVMRNSFGMRAIPFSRMPYRSPVKLASGSSSVGNEMPCPARNLATSAGSILSMLNRYTFAGVFLDMAASCGSSFMQGLHHVAKNESTTGLLADRMDCNETLFPFMSGSMKPGAFSPAFAPGSMATERKAAKSSRIFINALRLSSRREYGMRSLILLPIRPPGQRKR